MFKNKTLLAYLKRKLVICSKEKHSRVCVGCLGGTGLMNFDTNSQGPVVQSIVSLTSSLRGQLIMCFTTL